MNKNNDFNNRRRFIRHPVCYPLQFEILGKKLKDKSQTLNVSEGGLLFVSTHKAEIGDIIILKLPIQNKLFSVKSKVIHLEKNEEENVYNIGVVFINFSDAFKVKLIEQIYLIDEYRALRSLQLGKEISLREASEEWIKRYSERFKRLYW